MSHDPAKLNPIERMVDDLLRFENFERAVEQSAATVAGERAEIAPRRPLTTFASQFAEVFGP